MVWDKCLSTQSTKALEKKLNGLTPIGKDQPFIYKVHEQLRDVNEKAYKPVLLAIGPYNDQDKVGQGFLKEHKLRYLQKMLERTKQHVKTYIMALKDLEEGARKCYVECISQTPEEFVEMMLLDGCFIIELFRKNGLLFEAYDPTNEYDPIIQLKWVCPRIGSDLLLFENQLPFFVLTKLFEMSRNSGEHIIDIEKKGETRVESSTSTPQSIQTRPLLDLALDFFSEILPFEWNDKTSSYNSTETIEHLLCLGGNARTPSLPSMVWKRLEVGFRFKNKKFEHLLGLIHAIISISILDSEINRQGVGNKLKMSDQIFKHLFGPIHKAIISYVKKYVNSRDQGNTSVNWISIEHGIEFREAGVAFNMVERFMKAKRDMEAENESWEAIHQGFELREAGIKFKQAKKFNSLLRQDRPGPQMNGVELKASEKFKRLLCLNKIHDWTSIPYSEELRKARVKYKEAKKFKRILDLQGWNNIHCATELEEAGIKLKKAKECDKFSIKFNNGLLEISPLRIGDRTETYLRNLIAYEQYCGKDKAFNFITDYVCFIDDLIDSPRDVKLLRRRGIIHNYLGDDEVVSKMVNKLGHNLNISTRSSIYARTSMDMNSYCNRTWNTWEAKLRRDYCNSPWAFISFLAAVLLLVLTIVQTIFSIIP